MPFWTLEHHIRKEVPIKSSAIDKFPQLSLLEGLDELGMVKQIIAKENQYIIETELPDEDGEPPSLPEGKCKNQCSTGMLYRQLVLQ